MKFNVTKIVPEGFMHTQAFNEVIESLSWSLSALGHEVNCTENWLSEQQETNIIFGAEVMADYQKLPKGSIIFNLEQPSHPNIQKVKKLAQGLTVWDFSMRNVRETWKDHDPSKIKHVPLGYTPNLTRIPKDANQDWDICFFGWMTPRRVAIVGQLKAAGLKVFASAACYGGGRDNIISRSKICLNLHHDGRDMFEIVRISYLMSNSKCVLSEESVDDEDYEDLKGGFSNVPYRLLVDRAIQLAKGEYGHYEDERASRLIRKRDFTNTVALALDDNPTKLHIPATNPEKISSNGNVYTRYQRGRAEGDMKDFMSWMRAHAKGNIMEIGVRDGASTSAFLMGIEENGGHLYSVDVQDCGHRFSGHPQWTFIKANSTDFLFVIKQIPYEIDILLIDGDHSRAGVISDFQYARQLRPGGMVLFHDIAPEEKPTTCTDMSWPGDAAKEVFEEFAVALQPLGWTKEILPGRYGMGILRKPA